MIGGSNGVPPLYDVQKAAIQSPAQTAHYERVVDIGTVAGKIDSLSYNGTAKCGAKIQFALGDTIGVFGALATLREDAVPGSIYPLGDQSQIAKRYVRVIITLNDQSCGGTSNAADLTVNYLLPPVAPTLSQPTAAQTGLSTLPDLRLVATDPDADYVKYKIQVCSNSTCTVVVRTIDETLSQVGWQSQSQQNASAYSSGQMAIHTYQAAALSAGTQYWWRAYAIDPGAVMSLARPRRLGRLRRQRPLNPTSISAATRPCRAAPALVHNLLACSLFVWYNQV